MGHIRSFLNVDDYVASLENSTLARAPNCIRLNNSIIEGMGDKVWHFGMDCHVNHTSQIAQTSYLIQKKGLVRNHLNRR